MTYTYMCAFFFLLLLFFVGRYFVLSEDIDLYQVLYLDFSSACMLTQLLVGYKKDFDVHVHLHACATVDRWASAWR